MKLLKSLSLINLGVAIFAVLYLILIINNRYPAEQRGGELRSLYFYLIFCIPALILFVTSSRNQARWVSIVYLMYVLVFVISIANMLFFSTDAIASGVALVVLVSPFSLIVSIIILASFYLSSRNS